ncbi:hypothetical protein KZP23_21600 [Echinicola marina]|uniref:hypothetical protein n=1 Tax=Echinicola marina TaxID=2859768 RepID=UPI001CF63B42|nr:hypothetical protein [Echinicola marina]UCS93212.1 hypothetical protein KZP23_21600 [Echinicola marina]
MVNTFVVSTWVNDGNTIDKWIDLEIHKFVTTDTDYKEAEILAPFNNQFSYDYTYNEGLIKYKLYRPSDDTYLAETPIKADLPRGYEIPPEEEDVYNSPFVDRNYLYDAALSLLSATGLKEFELADKIVKGILVAQFLNGAFPFGANHSSPNYQYNDAYFRVGAIAWVAYALGFYLEYRRSPENRSELVTAISNTLNYIASLENNPVGLPTGGSGRYEGEEFNPNYSIGWISTEHCIDCYFALKQAGKVLKDSVYKHKANTVKNLMLNELWDEANQRFYQGISDAQTNTKDTADALDCNSWGYLFLAASGEARRGQNLLVRLEQYYYVEDVETGAKGYTLFGLMGLSKCCRYSLV